MILNGHSACQQVGLFPRFFKATAVSAGDAGNRASSRSLVRHTWTFDDGLDDIPAIYRDHFAPAALRFQFFVCPALVDAWAAGRVAYVREQLRNPRATLISWDEIGRLADAGNILGSHGVDHTAFDALSRDQAIEQLERSRELIEERTGHRPTSFAFPFGSVRPSSRDAGVLARGWYDEVHLSDNALALGEIADGVYNRRHAEFGVCAYRGIFVGALNVLFGVKRWRS